MLCGESEGKSAVKDQPTELHRCRMGKPDDQEARVPLLPRVEGINLSACLSGFSTEQRTPEP